MSGHQPRVFYGWWVVFAAALGLCLGSPPILVFSFGLFLRALSQEFHTGRAAISLAFTLHNLISAVSAPLVGLLVDRYGCWRNRARRRRAKFWSRRAWEPLRKAPLPRRC